ncbi:TMEM175 family protein [Amnibacterium setariae]|uniref:DUF1211 domain-containing protein n=1 Tax=Amnibacterium setariae TaxID=2306585 RepID=A0A3A1U6B4_9MICO|nr:TMEM175 family protein [Amnibacterium setariae]RIX30558.1 DUF1211 domain-containing protein [Amnibacterium setariae]
MEAERGRSVDRLVTFVDAVVAIAITLLALPLTEITREVAEKGLEGYLDDKVAVLVGFTISFFVIARLWWGHHRIFEHVVRWDRPLVVLTVFWLFTVVLLPPATALTNQTDPREQPGVIAAYIGVMAVSGVFLTALSWRVHRHPELTDGRDTASRQRLAGSVSSLIGFVLALVIGTLLPQVNYFALLVLVLTGRLGDLVERRLRRR